MSDSIENLKVGLEVDSSGLSGLSDAMDSAASHSEQRMQDASEHMSRSLESVVERATIIGEVIGNLLTEPIRKGLDLITEIPRSMMELGNSMQTFTIALSTQMSDVAMKQMEESAKATQDAMKANEGATSKVVENAKKKAEAVQRIEEDHAQKLKEIDDRTSQLEEDHQDRVAQNAQKEADIRQTANETIQADREKLAEKLDNLSESHAQKEETLAKEEESVKEDYLQKEEQAQEAHTAKLSELDQQYATQVQSNQQAMAEENQSFNDRMASLAEGHQTQLDEIEQSHTEKRRQLEEQLAQNEEKYQAEVAQVTEQYQSAITNLYEQHIQRRENLESQLNQLATTYQDQLGSAAEQYAAKMESLETQLANKIMSIQDQIAGIKNRYAEDTANAASTLTQKQEMEQERLAAAQEQYENKIATATSQAQKDNAKVAYDIQVASINATLKAAEDAYNKQTSIAKQRSDDELKIKNDQIAQEEATYAAQVATETARYNGQIARLKDTYDKEVMLLNQRISQEDSNYDRQRAKLDEDYARRTAQLQSQHDREVELLKERVAQEDASYESRKAKADEHYNHQVELDNKAHALKLQHLDEQAEKEKKAHDEAIAREDDRYNMAVSNDKAALEKKLASIHEKEDAEQAAYDKAVAAATAAETQQEALVAKQEAKALASLAEQETQEEKNYNRSIARQDELLKKENELFARKVADAQQLADTAQSKADDGSGSVGGGKMTPGSSELPAFLKTLAKETNNPSLAEFLPDSATEVEKMAHNDEKADATKEWLLKIAPNFPHTVEDMMKYTQTMIGMQLDPAKWMQTTSDIGAGLNQDPNQVARAFGMFRQGNTALASREFRGMGLNLTDILGKQNFDAMGSLDVEKLTGIKGDPTAAADKALDMLQEKLNTRFAGTSARLSKTIPGLISDFTDIWQEGIEKHTKPAFDSIQKSLLGIYEWMVSEGKPAAEEFFKSIGQIADKVGVLINNGFVWFKDHGPEVRDTLVEIGHKIQDISKYAIDLLGGGLQTLRDFFQFLNDHGISTAAALQGVVVALGAYKAAMITQDVLHDAQKGLEALGAAWKGVASATREATEATKAAAEAQKAMDVAQGVGEAEQGAAGMLAGGGVAKKAEAGAAKEAESLLSKRGGILGILSMATGLGEIGLAIAAIIGALGLLYLAWTNDWGGIQEKTDSVVKFLVGAFNTFLRPTLEQAGRWFESLYLSIQTPIQQIWMYVQSIFGDIGKLFGDLFGGANSATVLGDLGKLVGDVLGLMGTWEGMMLGLLGRIGGDLMSGMGKAIGDLMGFIGKTVGDALGLLGSLLFGGKGGGAAGGGSKEEGMAPQIIGQIFQALMDAIAKNGPGLASKVGDLLGTILAGIWQNVKQWPGVMGAVTLMQEWNADIWIQMNNLGSTIGNLPGTLGKAIGDNGAKLGNAIFGPGGSVTNWSQGGILYDYLAAPFRGAGGLLDQAGTWLTALPQKLVDGLSQSASILGRAIFGPGGSPTSPSSGGIIYDTIIWPFVLLPASALKWAGDMAQGFLDGIKNAAGGIAKGVGDWVNDNIANPVRDKLGIHSASTVFNQMGVDTVTGFSDGIKKQASSSQIDITTVFNNIKDAVSGVWTNLTKNLFGGGSAQGDQASKQAGAVTQMVADIEAAFDGLKSNLMGQGGVIGQISAGIGKIFTDLKNSLVGGGKDSTFDLIKDGIRKTFEAIQKDLVGEADKGGGLATTIASGVKDTFSKLQIDLVGLAKNTGFFGNIHDGIRDLWADTNNFLIGSGQAIGLIPSIQSRTSGLFEIMRNDLVGATLKMGTTGNIHDGLEERWKDVRSILMGTGEDGLIPTMTKNISNAFKNLRDDFVGSDGNGGVMKTLKDAMVNGFNAVKSAADAAREAIERFNSTHPNNVAPGVGGFGPVSQGGGQRGPTTPGGFAPNQASDPSLYARAGSGPTTPWDGLIQNAMNRVHPPFDMAFVKAIMQQESQFDAGAKSPSGAIGLMQLMPFLADELGVNPYNNQDNIYGGIKQLSYLWKLFGGNVGQVAAAYNAGAGAVETAISMGLPGGIPNASMGAGYAETAAYVPAIMGYYQQFEQMGSAASNWTSQQIAAIAESACGPAAAAGFANWAGHSTSLADAVRMAANMNVWDTTLGMHSLDGEVSLINALGVSAHSTGPNWPLAAATAAQGLPVGIDTANHYYLASGYDPSNNTYFVGNTGLVVSGKEWMTADQMQAAEGQAQGMIFAGQYETGGVIPGRVGDRLVAILHGQEEVLSVGQRGQLNTMADILERVLPILRGTPASSTALASVGGAQRHYHLTYIGREYGKQDIDKTLRQMELTARMTGNI